MGMFSEKAPSRDFEWKTPHLEVTAVHAAGGTFCQYILSVCTVMSPKEAAES